MALIPTLGLEIHAELVTASKVFCSCSAAFGGEENSRCCPVCSGLPGTLPVLNRSAVEFIIKAGAVMNCSVSNFTKWDRKNYFYPDLPKAYQISQMPRPVCLNGKVEIEVDGVPKTIRINRIHLEEDAGKLIHEGAVTLADYNRCGVPLIEIVTEPDFGSAKEVAAFVEKVRLLLIYAGICDGKMEQGSMRCDVNLSLAEENADKLGTRTETKNLNSLRSINAAIQYEIDRQTEVINNGGKVIQETRRFSVESGETSSLRSKENSHDYRYFPDPDIPPVVLSDEEIKNIVSQIPELPDSRFKRYVETFNLSKTDANILITEPLLSNFFNDVVSAGANPKSAAAFVLTELMSRLNLFEGTLSEKLKTLKFSAKDFARLIEIIESGKVNRANLKDILGQMFETGNAPDGICTKNNLFIKEDLSLVDQVLTEIVKSAPEAAAQFRAGEKKVFSFFMGQANKRLKGAAHPNVIKDLLEKKLNE